MPQANQVQESQFKAVPLTGYGSQPIVAAVKDVDMAGRIVTGYFSAFDNIDRDGDVIIRGAYAKTIAAHGPKGTQEIKHLNQHDVNRLLGTPHVLLEDNFGLYFETGIAKTSWGNDVLALYQAGTINNHSVRIDIVDWKIDQDTGARILKELRLWEGSSVVWGANPKTPAMGLKSLKEAPLFVLDEQISRLRRALGLNLSDETCQDLEKHLASLEAERKAKDSPSDLTTTLEIKLEDGLLTELRAVSDQIGRQIEEIKALRLPPVQDRGGDQFADALETFRTFNQRFEA